MQRIYSDLIRKYRRYLAAAESKAPDENYYYLDLANKYLYFRRNSGERFQGRLSIEVESTDGISAKDEKLNAFWVESSTFLSLCNYYEYILFDSEEVVFSHGEESFNLSVIEDYFSPIDFEDTSDLELNVIENESDFTAIKKAFDYTTEKIIEERKFNGVLLSNKKVTATDASRMFVGELTTNFEQDLYLPQVSEFIFTEAKAAEVSLNLLVGEHYFMASVNNELIIYFSQPVDISAPAINDPSFVEKFDHDTSFSVNKDYLQEVLQFFTPFVKDVPNYQMYFTIEDSSKLSLNAHGQKSSGKRNVPLVSVDSSLEGESFWMNQRHLYQAITDLEGGRNVKIQFKPEKVAVKISLSDSDDDSYAVLLLLDE